MKISFAGAASVLPLLIVSGMSQAESVYDTDAVVVTASRMSESASSSLSPVVVITAEDIERYQITSFAGLAARLPGIDLYMAGGRGQSTNLQVRGGSSADALVLVNGVKINSAYDRKAYLERIPVNQIERVEYVRGARAALYGSGTGSAVINIITRPGFGEKEIRVSGRYSKYLNRQGSVSVKLAPTENSELKIAVGAEKERGYNVHPVDGFNDGDKHGFQQSNLMIDYQHALGDFTLFANASLIKSKSQFDSSSADYYWHEYDGNEFFNASFDAGVSYDSDFYSGKLKLNYQKTDDYMQIVKSPYPDDSKHDNTPIHVRTIGANWTNVFTLSEKITLAAGADITSDRLMSNSKAYYAPIKPEHERISNQGIFAMAQYGANSSDGFRAEASGRYDHNTQFGGHWTGQGGIGYYFGEGFRTSLRYGSSFSAPGFSELYYPCSWGTDCGGNPNLKPEKGNSLELAFFGKVAGLEWRLAGYENRYRERIIYDLSSMRYMNIAKARIRGAELELSKRFALEDGWIGFSIYGDVKSARNKSDDVRIPLIPRRSLKLLADYKKGGFDASASILAYSSKTYSSSSDRRIGGYAIWNFAVGYQFESGFRIFGKLDNAFGKQYELAKGYKTPESVWSLGFEFKY